MAQGMLEASVAAGESGPVIVLAGEADLTGAEQLSELVAGQLAGGTRQLTIDVSGLRFADSASIRVLVLAARTLRERDGSLVLLHPQRPLAKVLALLGADQMVTIGGGAEATSGLGELRVSLHPACADRCGPAGRGMKGMRMSRKWTGPPWRFHEAGFTAPTPSSAP